MTKLNRKAMAVMAAGVLAAMSASSPAMAGGLFGKRGLIRGTIGTLLDPVEKKVLTPVARVTTVVVATAGGAVAGSYIGQPQLGAAVGMVLGESINEQVR